MKKVVLLGSTGSIGTNCLSVVREFDSHFQIVGLAAGSDIETLAKQVAEFRPSIVALGSEEAATEFERRYGASGLTILAGERGVRELACHDEAHVVVNGLVGAVGLVPTVEAIRAGKQVALANKESVVLAGETVMALAKKHRVRVLPVDSEHSGIHQCLNGRDVGVRKIVLTASGGPFLGKTPEELRSVTPEDVIRHPVWRMGRRICVDSATLLNKGFEVIEARWLFALELSRIGVLIHTQCAVHALVEFTDGTTMAQISRPDMRIPILYAMAYPERLETGFESCGLETLGSLTFAEPKVAQFPCLGLAYAAAEAGGTVPAQLNAADEVAVRAFFDGRIGFVDIPVVLETTLGRLKRRPADSIGEILDADREARSVAEQVVSERFR